MAIDSGTYTIYNQHVTTWRYICDWSIINQLLSDFIKGTISGYSLADLFSNNSDYICDIKFYPLRLELLTNGTPVAENSITIGKKTGLSYSCYRIGTNGVLKPYYKLFSKSLTRTFNNFLDYAPYTKYKLIIPYFPIFELDGKDLYGHTLDGYITVDFNSGRANAMLYIDDTYLYKQASVQLGIEIPFGKSNMEDQKRNLLLSAISFAGDMGGIVAGAYSGSGVSVAGGIKSYTKTVTGLLESQVDHYTGSKVGSAGMDLLIQPKKMYLIKEEPIVIHTPNAHLEGLLLNDVKTLSTLTGFTKVGDIHFNTNGADIYSDEVDEIISLLKNGVIL